MPSSYAVLGATGNVGHALLEVFSQSPDDTVHAYCRNKHKLLELSPGIDRDDRVRIFEGGLQEINLLVDCLRGTKAAFLTVAASGNVPGCSIAMEATQAVVAAYECLEAQGEKLPRLLVLSSASLDHSLMSQTPEFILNILYRAVYYVYEDLRRAEAFLRTKESLVSATFIRPSALCVDRQRGHTISRTEARAPLSFLDLAAGMIEVAREDGDVYHFKGIAVNPTSKDVAFPWQAPLVLAKGLLLYFFPWLHSWLL